MGNRALLALHRISRRGADADAQPGEVLAAQVGDRAAQAVMAAGAAAGAQPQPAQGQVHVVHQEQQLAGLQAIPIEGGPDRAAAVVHEGLGHQQPQAAGPLPHLTEKAMQFGLVFKRDASGGG